MIDSRRLKVPDASYDLDGDGVVGSIDFAIARRFDGDHDYKLSTAERSKALQSIENGEFDHLIPNPRGVRILPLSARNASDESRKQQFHGGSRQRLIEMRRATEMAKTNELANSFMDRAAQYRRSVALDRVTAELAAEPYVEKPLHATQTMLLNDRKENLKSEIMKTVFGEERLAQDAKRTQQLMSTTSSTKPPVLIPILKIPTTNVESQLRPAPPSPVAIAQHSRQTSEVSVNEPQEAQTDRPRPPSTGRRAYFDGLRRHAQANRSAKVTELAMTERRPQTAPMHGINTKFSRKRGSSDRRDKNVMRPAEMQVSGEFVHPLYSSFSRDGVFSPRPLSARSVPIFGSSGPSSPRVASSMGTSFVREQGVPEQIRVQQTVVPSPRLFDDESSRPVSARLVNGNELLSRINIVPAPPTDRPYSRSGRSSVRSGAFGSRSSSGGLISSRGTSALCDKP
jgi:hypothetical protein